jgi:hypothetical protein
MFLRKAYGIAGLYGVPFIWYDTVSPIINLFLVIFAVTTGYLSAQWATILYGLIAYWLLLTFVTISGVVFDRERNLWQIGISPLLIFYSTFLDGVRTAVFVEEILALRMKWETPRR